MNPLPLQRLEGTGVYEMSRQPIRRVKDVLKSVFKEPCFTERNEKRKKVHPGRVITGGMHLQVSAVAEGSYNPRQTSTYR